MYMLSLWLDISKHLPLAYVLIYISWYDKFSPVHVYDLGDIFLQMMGRL